jgi:hypothetical protein
MAFVDQALIAVVNCWFWSLGYGFSSNSSSIHKLTHPQLLKGLKKKSQVEDIGKEKELAHAL